MMKKISKSFLEKEQVNWLGASEVPILFGCGYITLNDLFLKKLGLLKQTQNFKMKIGLALENLIYEEVKQINPETNFVRNDYLYGYFDETLKICAIPDFVDNPENPNIVGEIKTSASSDINKSYYLYQIQTQLLLTNAKCAILALYVFGDNNIKVDLVYPDENIFNEIKEKSNKFWQDFENFKNNQSVDINIITTNQTEEKKIKQTNESIYNAYLRYNELNKKKKEIEEEMEIVKQAILNEIEGQDILMFNDKQIAIKVERTNETFDKNKLKLYLQDKYKDFVNISKTIYYKIKEEK
ncbi:MAG: hypothetical protein QXJ06_00515 [Candidatus Aenigmatarchaeota archaeon]